MAALLRAISANGNGTRGAQAIALPAPLGRVPGVAAAAAEGAAAASSGAIGGSSASVEAARAVAEEKFRRTGEEQEASATKLSTETWALKVKVLTDSITKLPPGTTRDSAEAQLQKLLDETPG